MDWDSFKTIGASGLSTNDLSSIENSNGLPAGTLSAVMKTESNGDPTAIGADGEKGVFQFMPHTAEEYNIDPTNSMQSAHAAGKYIGTYYKQTGDLDKALTAYNAGAGHIDSPPESTQKYIQKVKSNMPNQSSNQKTDWSQYKANSDNTSTNWDQYKVSNTNNDNSNQEDHSGLSDVIGSKMNSIAAGASDNPVSQGVGSVLGGTFNTGYNIASNLTDGTNLPMNPLTNIKNAWNNTNIDQDAAHAANPTLYGIGEAAPYLAGAGIGSGLTGVAKVAAGMAGQGAIAAEQAKFNNKSNTQAAEDAAMFAGMHGLGEALPIATKVGANLVGNTGKGYLNILQSPGEQILKSSQAANIPKSVQNLFTDFPKDAHPAIQALKDMALKNPLAGTSLKKAGYDLGKSIFSPGFATAAAGKYGSGALSFGAEQLQKLTGTKYMSVFQNIINSTNDPIDRQQRMDLANQVLTKNDPYYKELMGGVGMTGAAAGYAANKITDLLPSFLKHKSSDSTDHEDQKDENDDETKDEEYSGD